MHRDHEYICRLAALNAVTTYDGYDAWTSILGSAKKVGIDFEDFDAWCARFAAYTSTREVAGHWQRAKTQVGGGTLYWHATQGGWHCQCASKGSSTGRPTPRSTTRPQPRTRYRHQDTHLPGGPAAVTDVKDVPVLTVQDLLNTAIWIPVSNKGEMLADYRTRPPWAYFHSLSQATDGNVRLARFGGFAANKRPGNRPDAEPGIQIQPWMTYTDCLTTCQATEAGYQPSLCLAGDESAPAPLPIGVLDVDYEPAKDSDTWQGLRWRNACLRAAGVLEMPAFTSSGSHGLHLLYHSADVGNTAIRRTQDKHHGFLAENFVAGSHSRRMVALRIDKALAGTSARSVLPKLGWRDVFNVTARIMDGERVAGGRDWRKALAEAPANPPPGDPEELKMIANVWFDPEQRGNTG